MKILVTGGAGFIGSFLVDKLLDIGHDVRILDNLEPQVHPNGKPPDYLNKKAEFVKADMTDYKTVEEAVKDVEVVFHEAALVGVGQSMYQVRRYVNANVLGTANLMDVLVNKEHDVKKVIVASSMSTYGEGAYECKACGNVSPKIRPEKQMKNRDWEIHCPKCGKVLLPKSTPEDKKQEINSIYALTKKDQEDMVINIGRTYGLPCVALRYFNVFGPRQALSNPYTGVVAIFLSRIKNRRPPVIFEDGMQSRDFICVHDIVQANILAMKSKSADYEIFNVGRGMQTTIKEVAESIAKLNNLNINPKITGEFRKGDVRHCFADITKIKSKLGFEPEVSFEKGMLELMEWSKSQKAVDKLDVATQELKYHGLVK